MHTPAQTVPAAMPEAETAAPSADFIYAISQFLDTDPSDLLRELGYYSRETDSVSSE